jgi:uncharacterized membrane protein
MTMAKKVLILNFEEESKAYQAFSEIKKLHVEKQLKGEQMAVVTHINDGQHKFKMDDFLDFTGNDHTSKDSLIGMVVGILGGPLGIMLGWFAGTFYGASQDAKEIQTAQTIFDHVIEAIGEGQTGLILIANEEDNRPLNQLIVNELGGKIRRLELAEVETEIQNAQAVVKEAKASWHKKMANGTKAKK